MVLHLSGILQAAMIGLFPYALYLFLSHPVLHQEGLV